MGTQTEAISQIRAVRDDLDKLRHFADGIEDNLREQHPSGQPPAEDSELWRLAEVLPWLYRGSALLTILGFLEHNLNAVCDTLRREYGRDAAVTDLPGKGLRRAKHYISKHIGLDFPADSSAWYRLLKYSDIRNLIAHRDGLVKEGDPELIRFIRDEPNLTIDTGGRIRLQGGALAGLIEQVETFFEELEHTVDGTARR